MIRGVFHLRAILPCGKVVEATAHNTPTHEGLRFMLDAAAGTFIDSPEVQTLRFKMGFVASAGFTGYAQTDLLTSHPGWTEDTVYGRRFISAGLATDSVDFRTATKVFTHSDSSTNDDLSARGLFMASTFDNTGILWNTADFAEGPQAIPAGSDLTVTYTVTLDS